MFFKKLDREVKDPEQRLLTAIFSDPNAGFFNRLPMEIGVDSAVALDVEGVMNVIDEVGNVVSEVVALTHTKPCSVEKFSWGCRLLWGLAKSCTVVSLGGMESWKLITSSA